MGIVNVTPDSFSDGGQFLDPAAAVAHALEQVAQGAEIIDVGGESTRPGAQPVSEAEELRRVIPVIEQLASRLQVPISVDTMKPAVARAALQAGASLVNDVAAALRGGEVVGSSAFQQWADAGAASHPGAECQSDAMWRVIAEFGAGYVCMHMQGTPQTMQVNPAYGDVAGEVGDYFDERLRRLNESGVSADQVVLDVGIGFGKTVEHNFQLLAGLRSFTRLGRPLLLGTSRKSFIGKLLGADVAGRLGGSLACAGWAVQAGAQLIRTHDVAEAVQAIRVTEAILAHKK